MGYCENFCPYSALYSVGEGLFDREVGLCIRVYASL